MTTKRTEALVRADRRLGSLVDRLVGVAEAGLPAMYRADAETFVFTKAAVGTGWELRGRSIRYAAITVLGARYLPEERQRRLFGGRTATEYTGVLIRQVQQVTNLGDAALVAWAAAETRHPDLDVALVRLAALDDLDTDLAGATGAARRPRYTVEAAWVLSALASARGQADVEKAFQAARARLLQARIGRSPLFPHATGPGLLPWYRSHIGCFADQTYPLQALARAHASGGPDGAGDPEALAAADACGARICELQGEGGQWWWHYDARRGSVVEGYPVYSVHQHAMAPTALFDLAEAGGTDQTAAVRRGLAWMTKVPELAAGPGGEPSESMIRDDDAVTWRKVHRGDPRKAVRAANGISTRILPGLRMSPLDLVFRPVAVDRECRPYEFGWLLHAWLGSLDGPAAARRERDGTA